jgi:hypothetical protein
MKRHGFVMPKIFSISAENLSHRSRIFGGCSIKVVSIFSFRSGFSLINSAAATIKARSPLISCRRVESLWFNSAICCAVNVTGLSGKPIESQTMRRASADCKPQFQSIAFQMIADTSPWLRPQHLKCEINQHSDLPIITALVKRFGMTYERFEDLPVWQGPPKFTISLKTCSKTLRSK